MNMYALLLAAIGVSIATQSKENGMRAVGSILAGAAGSVLLQPHIRAAGDPSPAPLIVR